MNRFDKIEKKLIRDNPHQREQIKKVIETLKEDPEGVLKSEELKGSSFHPAAGTQYLFKSIIGRTVTLTVFPYDDPQSMACILGTRFGIPFRVEGELAEGV